MKVSIIIPVYNIEQYLDKCLTSLVNQTYKNIEIIVVNDGSTDSSSRIIEKYKKKYPDIISYYKKKNGGTASARNFGLAKATGDYVMFVDSDDWVETDIVEKLYNKIISSNADIVVCNSFHVIDDKIIKFNDFKKYSDDNHKNYILNCSGPCWQLIKRSIFSNNNIQFLINHFYEDIAIIPSLCLYANKIEYIEDNLYYYLIRTGSTMNQVKYSKSLEDIFDSLNNLVKIFKEKKAYKKYYFEIENIFIEHLLHAASLRFLRFEKYDMLNKIINLIKNEYPKWYKNKYFIKKPVKYRIMCFLLYLKKYKLIKLLSR